MYKILIIDDEMKTREEIYKFMFANRFILVCIESDENVINNILSDQYFDCIIIDNNLDRGLSKEEVLEVVSEYHYPIIMVSNSREFTLKEYDKENFIDCISLSQIFALRDVTEIPEKSKFQEKFIRDLCDRVERDIFYYRGYGNDEKKNLVICHMSDIQFGDKKANENDLRTLFDKLEIFILNLDSNIDVLLLTGDIVFSGKEKEFSIAKEVIKKFKESMKRRRHEMEIILIPGNHDFDYQCYLLDMDGKYDLDDSEIKDSFILNGSNELHKLSIKPDYFKDFEANSTYLANFRNFAYEITNESAYQNEDFFIRCEKFAKSGFAIEGINNAYKFHKNKDGMKRYMFEYTGKMFGNFVSPLYTIVAGHVYPNDLGYKYLCNDQSDRCNENNFRMVCAKKEQCEKWGDMEQLFEQCNCILYLCGHVHYTDISISDDKKRLFVSAAAPTGVNPNEKAINIIELENKERNIEVTVSKYDANPSNIKNKSTNKLIYYKDKKAWEKV